MSGICILYCIEEKKTIDMFFSSWEQHEVLGALDTVALHLDEVLPHSTHPRDLTVPQQESPHLQLCDHEGVDTAGSPGRGVQPLPSQCTYTQPHALRDSHGVREVLW